MCGIVGMVGNLDYKDKEVFSMMLHFCELRGEDSTGYFSVAKAEKHAVVHKVVGPTRNMFDSLAYDRLTTSTKRVLIGHCRKATVGGIKRSTAHPFNYGDITGVHNGTLKNWRYLPGEAEETDSATLFENFSRVGVRETIEAVDGAYALVWWDEATETLNVLKNNERPLYYAFDERFEKLVFASEPWMISVACSKGGLKLADLTPRETTMQSIMAVDNDNWWRIKPGRGGSKDALVFHGKSDGHDEDLKGGVNPAKYQAPPFQQGKPYASPFSGAHHGVPQKSLELNDPLPVRRLASPAATSTAAASTTTSDSSSDTSTEASGSSTKDSQTSRPTLTLVHDSKSDGSASLTNEKGEPIIVGFNGLVLTKDEFDVLVDPNCIWCQTPISFDEIVADPKSIGDWTDEDSYLCQSCVCNCHDYSKGAF